MERKKLSLPKKRTVNNEESQSQVRAMGGTQEVARELGNQESAQERADRYGIKVHSSKGNRAPREKGNSVANGNVATDSDNFNIIENNTNCYFNQQKSVQDEHAYINENAIAQAQGNVAAPVDNFNVIDHEEFIDEQDDKAALRKVKHLSVKEQNPFFNGDEPMTQESERPHRGTGLFGRNTRRAKNRHQQRSHC